MTAVVYHRADFDGQLSGAICRHFLRARGESVRMIGWDYGDPVPEVGECGRIYLVDLSIPALMEDPRLTWIDHHKSALARWPDIPGYQIDGVAACRLCWQFFTVPEHRVLPTLEHYTSGAVPEPYLIRLAGQYDVWDLSDPNARALQLGLADVGFDAETSDLMDACDGVHGIIERGRILEGFVARKNAQKVNAFGFFRQWQGLKFLCLNGSGNSLSFQGHERIREADALMLFRFGGRHFKFSLYHAPGQEHRDLSEIARSMGGGGHRGACGFECSWAAAAEILGSRGRA